jgi:putative endonuclease
MPCVYILFSSSNQKHYTGSSREDEPSVRLKQHNSSRVRSSKSGVPWQLIHVEYYTTYTEALKREKYLKSGKGRAWIKENIHKE